MYLAEKKSHTLRLLAQSLVFPVALLSAWLYYPFAFDGLDLCLWRRLFGIRCPSCGLTRAMCSFVHGEFAQALNYNPLILLVLPVLLGLSLVASLKLKETLWDSKKNQPSALPATDRC